MNYNTELIKEVGSWDEKKIRKLETLTNKTSELEYQLDVMEQNSEIILADIQAWSDLHDNINGLYKEIDTMLGINREVLSR